MENQHEKMSNTPYDDAFRTMMEKSGNLRLPFINEMFHLHEPIREDTPTENVSNEYFIEEGKGQQRKIITDSVLHINGRTYHIKCQSLDDGTILVRMFEYDITIALKESTYDDFHLTVEIPESGVLFLRKTAKTPKQMTVTIKTRGGSVDYPVGTISLADYTLDDLIRKNLLFLFPFYLFNVEGEFKKYEAGEEGSREEVVTSLSKLLEYANKLYEEQKLTVDQYLLVTDMIKKVTDHLTQNYPRVRKELDDIMGGKVLEFKGEKIFNAGKEENKKEVALRMIRAGKLSDADIADYSGLSESEVEKLREEETAVMA